MSVIGPNLVVTSIADPAAPDYDISDAQALQSSIHSQHHHFWFAARNAVITRLLTRVELRPPDSILEVGCGAGTVLRHLQACGYHADGVDMHLALCREAAARCPGATIYCHDLLRHAACPVSHRYQAVGLFDVLEHITDTTTFLNTCKTLLTDSGIVIGTVPASTSLWSTYDQACGHKRRYTAPSLGESLQAAGWRVLKLGYFFHSLLPAMWIQRRRKLLPCDGPGCGVVNQSGRDRETGTQVCTSAGAATLIEILAVPPRPINLTFRALCAIERGLSRFLPLERVPGSSLYFAARP